MQNEANCRIDRRHLGLIAAEIDQIDVENDVVDPRTRQGSVKHKLRQVLTAAFAGTAAGCNGFAELEALTENLGVGARKLLNLPCRIPDTTAADLVVRLQPDQLRGVLYKRVKAANRAKRMVHDFVLRVVVLDGKTTTTFLHDDEDAKFNYGQINSATGQASVRTVTACLVSTPARPCLDACPIPAETNECGIYLTALDDLLQAYAHSLFDVVMYDSGAASLANATATKDRGLDYVFILDKFQPTMYTEAQRLLGGKSLDSAQASTTDLDGSDAVRRYIWVSKLMTGYLEWTHLRTVVRVCSVRTDKTLGEPRVENRYYISSIRHTKLSADQWLEMIRRRWSVENQNHNTFDTILREDKRPWLLRPQGMVVMHLIRRLVYNMLAIFRSVTSRSETSRARPWNTLLIRTYNALIRATRAVVEGIRPRAVAFS